MSVCNKAATPLPHHHHHHHQQFWQDHTAVSQGYDNDEGFTNLDAAYITAAQLFKDRLLSDWLCAEIEIPPTTSKSSTNMLLYRYSDRKTLYV